MGINTYVGGPLEQTQNQLFADDSSEENTQAADDTPEGNQPASGAARYEPLYLRYRPFRFDHLVGQEHAAKALRNAVESGNVGNAYMFSGPRGTGKTSAARILGRAANCESLDNGEPCGVCVSCSEFENGESLALHELDAATNNKTEDMLDLLETMSYAPVRRKKLYVLDEAHMLTPGAETALFRAMEDLPKDVVVVLCTTEPHMLNYALKSLARRLEFHLVGPDQMEDHIKAVAEAASLDVSASNLAYAIKDGQGSVRDALSALEQVVSSGSPPPNVSDCEPLLDAVVSADLSAVMVEVQKAVSKGKEPRVLAEEMIAELRNLFLAKMGMSMDFLPPDVQTAVVERCGQTTARHITQILEELGRCLVRMRQTTDARMDLELSFLNVMVPEHGKTAIGNQVKGADGLTREERAAAVGISLRTLGLIERVFPNATAVERMPPSRKKIKSDSKAAVSGGAVVAKPEAALKPTSRPAPEKMPSASDADQTPGKPHAKAEAQAALF